MGLEHLGGDALAADVEVLALAVECLEALGVRGFILALGHVGVFTGLAAAAGISGATQSAVRDRVESKDAAGVAEALRQAGASGKAAESLVGLATLAGGTAILDEARRISTPSTVALSAVANLEGVVRALGEAGLGDRFALDLGEVRGLDYYTGLVFRALAPGLGFEVGSGGRYDGLLARFGRPLPAVGFMLGLDRLDLLLQRQGVSPAVTTPASERVQGTTLGGALRAARALRAGGRRIRFGEGS
jgi:ATP phosphoribosyltransferase regulatory subunit